MINGLEALIRSLPVHPSPFIQLPIYPATERRRRDLILLFYLFMNHQGHLSLTRWLRKLHIAEAEKLNG